MSREERCPQCGRSGGAHHQDCDGPYEPAPAAPVEKECDHNGECEHASVAWKSKPAPVVDGGEWVTIRRALEQLIDANAALRAKLDQAVEALRAGVDLFSGGEYQDGDRPCTCFKAEAMREEEK